MAGFVRKSKSLADSIYSNKGNISNWPKNTSLDQKNLPYEKKSITFVSFVDFQKNNYIFFKFHQEWIKKDKKSS